jgi:hypothetical protein
MVVINALVALSTLGSHHRIVDTNGDIPATRESGPSRATHGMRAMVAVRDACLHLGRLGTLARVRVILTTAALGGYIDTQHDRPLCPRIPTMFRGRALGPSPSHTLEISERPLLRCVSLQVAHRVCRLTTGFGPRRLSTVVGPQCELSPSSPSTGYTEADVRRSDAVVVVAARTCS